MKIFVGSIIVLIIAVIITWFALSIFFKPVGGVIKKQANNFKHKMEEKDESE